MEVRIDGLAKRFVSHWVFRNLTCTIPAHTHLAITGPNGSGKSTLLKIISGALYPSEGAVSYWLNGASIPPDRLYAQIAFAAPYAEMIEEMTLREAYRFHRRFREFYPDLSQPNTFIEMLEFDFDPDQPMGQMSSGMKQRLRLAFALATRSSILLLDEPTSNLDTPGIQWFHGLLDHLGAMRTTLIASNVDADLRTCTEQINLDLHR